MSVSKLADKIIDAYAHDPEGLTREECMGLGLSTEQANLLSECLGYGKKGEITSGERDQLAASGFESEFINEIAGTDGNRALQERAKWLGDHVVAGPEQQDFDNKVRRIFVRELGDIGSEAEDAVQALIAALEDGDKDVRTAAAEALVKISSAAVPALIDTLKAEGIDEDVRQTAADVLVKIGPAAVPILVKTLKNKGDWFNRANAAIMLGRIDPVTPEVVSVLIDELKDEDNFYPIRETIAVALGRIGPVTPKVVPALISVLKDKGEFTHIRFKAAEALGKIGAVIPEVVPALVESMKSKDNDALCFDVVKVLGKIGSAAVPAMLETLNDKNKDVRQAAVAVLGKIGAVTPEVVPALILALKDKKGVVRIAAAKALGRIGPTAKEAVPALTIALKDKDQKLRFEAAETLVKIGSMTQEVVSVLIAAHEVTKKKILARLKAVSEDSFEHKSLSLYLEAMQELPYEFFLGIVDFRFYSERGRGGYYFDEFNYISLYGDDIKLSSFAHELAHHWDETFPRTISEIFDRISWTGIDEYRYTFEWVKIYSNLGIVPDRKDFDWADFAREYSLCNPNEDLATAVEEYIGNGRSFRERVRKEMDSGNFELAAKYLFVKHVMPFKGREYGPKDDSPALTIEKVKEKYLAAKDKSKTNPGTYDVILEIEKEYPLKSEPEK